MKTLLLSALAFVSLVFAVPNAFSAIEVGNGGQGVLINGKLVVLDVVEAGVEANPLFDGAVARDPWAEEHLTRSLGSLGAPVRLISGKLQEIGRLSPLLRDTLIQAAEAYSWWLVNSPLEDIPDSGGVVDPKGRKIVQLAVRAGRSIRIAAEPWSKLDKKNQAALILHELIYALMPLKDAGNGYRAQNAVRAREINGFLYTQGFAGKDRDRFVLKVGGDLALNGRFTGPGSWNFEETSLDLHFVVREFKDKRERVVSEFSTNWIPGAEGSNRITQSCFRSFSQLTIDQFVVVDISPVRRLKTLEFVDYASPRGLQTALIPVECANANCEMKGEGRTEELLPYLGIAGCEVHLQGRIDKIWRFTR